MNTTFEMPYTVSAFQFMEITMLTCTPAPFEVTEVEGIPASFFAGLADINAGRVVDMDRAHHETPPGV